MWWLRKLHRALQMPSAEHTVPSRNDLDNKEEEEEDGGGGHDDEDEDESDALVAPTADHMWPQLSSLDKQYAHLLSAAHTLHTQLSHVQAELNCKQSELAAVRSTLARTRAERLVSPSLASPTHAVAPTQTTNDVVTPAALAEHAQSSREGEDESSMCIWELSPSAEHTPSSCPPSDAATSSTAILYEALPTSTSSSMSASSAAAALQTALAKSQQSLKRVSLERTALRRKLEQRSRALRSAEEKMEELEMRLAAAQADSLRPPPPP